jgi:hypothetical protein|tara:strand:+ start:1285 stop:1824 length:540 start_codon:yes stop_codon:yes gene_type:complete
MANVNSPNGFTPAYHMSGGTIRPSEFAIASGTNASIFSGDVVNLSSGLVIQGTATGAPLGVFAGVEYQATDGSVVFSKVWTADVATLGAANAKAYVYSDPDIVYEAQSTGTPTQASIGTTNTISTTAGDSNTGRSKEGVTTTTSSGIATVVGFVDRPDNSIGQYARVYVIFPASVFGNN